MNLGHVNLKSDTCSMVRQTTICLSWSRSDIIFKNSRSQFLIWYLTCNRIGWYDELCHSRAVCMLPVNLNDGIFRPKWNILMAQGLSESVWSSKCNGIRKHRHQGDKYRRVNAGLGSKTRNKKIEWRIGTFPNCGAFDPPCSKVTYKWQVYLLMSIPLMSPIWQETQRRRLRPRRSERLHWHMLLLACYHGTSDECSYAFNQSM